MILYKELHLSSANVNNNIFVMLFLLKWYMTLSESRNSFCSMRRSVTHTSMDIFNIVKRIRLMTYGFHRKLN